MAALAAGSAIAQSSVEIYGVIDQSFATTSIDASAPAGNQTLKTTDTGNQSGLATQRLGFRGVEDLGGGLKARFQIESSLTAGNAGTNGFGSRPTFVGLEGSFGTILLGRQDTPLLKAVVPQLAGGANNIAGQLMWSSFVAPLSNDNLTAALPGTVTTLADAGLGRIARETTINQAINYITPTINGLSAEVQIGRSDAKLGGSLTGNAKTDNQGLNIRYAAGPLTLAVATHRQEAVTNNVVTRKNENDYVGATYNAGFATLSLQHGASKSTAANNVKFYDNKGTQFGAQIPVNAQINAFASYGKGERTFEGTDKFEQNSYQLGATYSLSKRTRIYTILGHQKLKGDSATTAGTSLKERQTAIGVSHTF